RLSWINDLRILLSRLYSIQVHLNISKRIDVTDDEEAMKSVKKSMEAWLDHELESSSRVRDILVGRMELDSDTRKLVKISLNFHHYLRITSPDHCCALTKMVLSGHSLAVESRHWKERGKKIVPHQ
ncbi:hypothetical protein B0H11DRAFT_1760485, partial [Mycena galericulata]